MLSNQTKSMDLSLYFLSTIWSSALVYTKPRTQDVDYKTLCLYDGKLSLCNNLSILCFSLLLLTLHSLIHSFSYSFTCIRLCLIQDKPPINSMCQTSVLLSLSFISELLVHICYIKTKVVKVCINLIERIHYSKLMISLYCNKSFLKRTQNKWNDQFGNKSLNFLHLFIKLFTVFFHNFLDQ